MNIDAHHIEIERLHARLAASGKRVIAITSPTPGEGVTSLSVALAHRSLLAGKSTLLVDLNLERPAYSHLLEFESVKPPGLLGSPGLLFRHDQGEALAGVTAPTRREVIMKLRTPGILEEQICAWLEEFDNIILDTASLQHDSIDGMPAERVAAASDACLLVVLAGKCTEAIVWEAVERLEAAGASLLGCILNNRDNPSLKNELLRETRRLEPRYSQLASMLRQWINRNRLLSLEI